MSILSWAKDLWKTEFALTKAPSYSPKKTVATVENPYLISPGVSVSKAFNHKELLEDLRYDLVDEDIIDRLMEMSPEFSHAMWLMETTFNTEIYWVGRNRAGDLSRTVTSKLNDLIKILTGNMYDGGYQRIKTLSKFAATILRYNLKRGGVGCEVKLGAKKRPIALYPFDSKWVAWVVATDRKHFVPIQYYRHGVKSLDKENILFMCLQENLDTGAPSSAFLAAINSIFFRLSVMRDLERAIKRIGYPRLDVEVVEEVIARNLPMDIRQDPEKLKKAIQAEMDNLKAEFNSLKPEESFVHTEAVKVDQKDAPKGTTINIDSLMKYLDVQISNALHTLPQFFGRGDTVQGEVDTIIYQWTITRMQKDVCEFLNAIFTYCLRMSGNSGTAHFYFEPLDLRSATELENHKLMKQKRILEKAYMGLLSFEEAMFQIDHKLPPRNIDKTWFETARKQYFGNVLGTTDDTGKDNGNYNQKPEEKPAGKKPGKDEKENTENIVTITRRGQGA